MFAAPRPAFLLTALLALGWVWLGQPPLATAQNPLGGEFQINTYTTGGQGYPAIASDRDGNFVVVWQTSELFGQGFDASGTPLGGEFRVRNTGRLDGTPPFRPMRMGTSSSSSRRAPAE